jgi:hypothetical protein
MQTYLLQNGQQVTLRAGCVMRGTKVLAFSQDAADFLLTHAVLDPFERYWLPYVVSSAASCGIERKFGSDRN